MARDENMIAALKRERAVYESRGDDNRVRQVDEQLRHYGHNPEQPAEDDGPQGRTGADPQQQTTQAATPAAKKTAPPPAKKTAAPPAKTQE
ncbi:hypothetical protein AMK26_10370 [Streptomyces sp. CB03234]|uniref:hypothetical protein n=1 Tax=Streptomyces sp. (strain CB03234) TaxID=1703937 RepID=UPI00093C44DC|nr:hypothetical protein [Streptomyces sp. CB03234]OKK06421.1 hypothetical protein AMK26_10370 [Streptomyces sp. CB03234]